MEIHVRRDEITRVVEFFLIEDGPDGVRRSGSVRDRVVVMTPVEENVRVEPLFRLHEVYEQDFVEALIRAVHPSMPDLSGELYAAREALDVERRRVDRVIDFALPPLSES